MDRLKTSKSTRESLDVYMRIALEDYEKNKDRDDVLIYDTDLEFVLGKSIVPLEKLSRDERLRMKSLYCWGMIGDKYVLLYPNLKGIQSASEESNQTGQEAQDSH